MSAQRAGTGDRGKRELRTALALSVPIAVVGFLALAGGGYELPVRQQLWLVIWWGLGLGLAFGVLPRAQPPGAWRLVAGGLAALGALQLLSMAWGPSADRALADASRTVGYLGVLALAWACLGQRSWRSAATGLFAVAAAVSAYALLGRLVPDLPGLDDPFGAGRLAEPLGYWNALGAWAAMTVAMALAWSADAGRARVRQAAAALLPVAGSVVYLTYSRGGVLATAIGVALVVALSRNSARAALHAGAAAVATAFCVFAIRGQPAIADGTGGEGALTVGLCVFLAAGGCWLFAGSTKTLRRRPEGSQPREARIALAAGAVFAALLVAVALVAGRDGFGHGPDGAAFQGDDPSARLVSASGNRSALWSEAIAGFAAQPLRGEGVGSFGYRWAMEGSSAELVNDPHSLPLAIASELGALGLAAFLASAAGLVLLARRGLAAARRGSAATGMAAALGAFLTSTAFDWTWEATALATLGLGCAGVLAMAAARSQRRTSGEPAVPTSPSPGLRWGAVGLALFFGTIQIPGVVSTHMTRESADQLRLGASRAAVARADEALLAAPWSAAVYAARAEAKLAAGDLDGARSDVEGAIEREPREAGHRILLAEIEAERGDLDAVAAAFGAAVRLSPHDPRLGSREVADIALRLERRGYDEADILERPPKPD